MWCDMILKELEHHLEIQKFLLKTSNLEVESHKKLIKYFEQQIKKIKIKKVKRY